MVLTSGRQSVDTNLTPVGERLLLGGATAGLTGINISGVGFRAATALMGGLYAVDISGLPTGTYTYTPVGTASDPNPCKAET